MRNSWLRQVRLALGLDRTPAAPVRTRRRLGVESLEDRSVPAVFTVTSLLDTVDASDGVLTLREAIIAANADTTADDITFQAGLTGTISLTGGQMSITSPVSITGNGAASTVIDAQQRSRIFDVTSAAGDVTLAGLTLTNGKTTGTFFGEGGAVRFRSGGTLTVTQSTLSGNSATSFDPGFGSGQGGAIYTDTGAVAVTQSTLSGNSAAAYDGSFGGAIWSRSGAVAVTQSTLSGNSARVGGAIYTDSGAVAVTQSTLSGNSAQVGGAIYTGTAPVTVRNSIVAGNTDGGTAPDIRKWLGTLTVESSLIGKSTGTGLTPTGPATPDANGNLIGDAAGIDPRLGPLASNGGPTQTMAVLSDSPARNRGSAAVASAFATDQRGAPFARVYGGGRADMGAFEALELVVDTTADEDDGNYGPGDLSLREAVRLANASPGADAITFAAATNGTEFDLSLGQMSITDPLTITGNGAASTVIDAQQRSRIFDVDPAAGDVTLAGLTLTNGRAKNGQSGQGGAVRFRSTGTLAVTQCTLSGNTATTSTLNFGSVQGGAIYSDSGAVAVTQSTLSGNSATANGDSSGGAIYSVSGAVAVTQSTLSGNSASSGNSGFGGAICTNSGAVAVTQSTLSGNSAAASGGAICTSSGAVTVTQSTLSGNSANRGGAILASTALVTVRNSIVAGNTAGLFAPDIYMGAGTLTVGSSLIGKSAGTGLTPTGPATPDANGNLIGGAAGIDPRLGPLANNGGPTQTMAVLSDSPARNRGSAAIASAFATDQRGTGFLRNRDGAADMGAFEDQRLSPTDIRLSNSTVPENQPVGTLVGTLSATDPDGGGSGGGSGGGGGGSGGGGGGSNPPPGDSPVTYALVSGAGDGDNAAFRIQGNRLLTNATFDFEARSSYSVRIRVTDPQGLWYEKAFTVAVGDVNERPTDITLSNNSVAENRQAGTAAGVFGTVDPDAGDTFTYTLVPVDGSTDHTAFTIDADGTLRTAASFDYEAKSSYTIRVRSTDAAGNTFTKDFVIAVTNVNEPPTVAVPGAQVGYEDVDLAVGGIVVGDPDSSTLTVTLTVSNGSLTVTSTDGLSVSGNGGRTVTLTGSKTQLNTALATLVYRGDLNWGGADTLTVSASDGEFTTTRTVGLTVRTAAEQAADLQARVAALRDAGVLNNGQANSLIVKLNLKGNNGDEGKVRAFLAQVQQLVLDGILTQAQADTLLGPGNILLLSVTRK